jgi:hypothetical protein
MCYADKITVELSVKKCTHKTTSKGFRIERNESEEMTKMTERAR